MLNCHQEDENVTATPCVTTDWKDVRGCMTKLTEKDCVVLGLMIGLVGPACEYLKSERGFYATVRDTLTQVKESFLIDDEADYNLVNIGKVTVSQFLPLYSVKFHTRRFCIYLPWFLASYLRGAKAMCHYAVISCFIMEVCVMAISRSFLGFLFPLIGITDHLFVLILRYLTLTAQAYGCSECYWKTLSKFFIFIPQTLISIIDFIRNYGSEEQERDKKGRYARK